MTIGVPTNPAGSGGSGVEGYALLNLTGDSYPLSVDLPSTLNSTGTARPAMVVCGVPSASDGDTLTVDLGPAASGLQQTIALIGPGPLPALVLVGDEADAVPTTTENHQQVMVLPTGLDAFGGAAWQWYFTGLDQNFHGADTGIAIFASCETVTEALVALATPADWTDIASLVGSGWTSAGGRYRLEGDLFHVQAEVVGGTPGDPLITLPTSPAVATQLNAVGTVDSSDVLVPCLLLANTDGTVYEIAFGDASPACTRVVIDNLIPTT